MIRRALPAPNRQPDSVPANQDQQVSDHVIRQLDLETLQRQARPRFETLDPIVNKPFYLDILRTLGFMTPES